MKKTGKLIVLDGADGAGKATQTKLLVDRLMAEGREVETMSFPQYEKNTFGKLLRECLDGERGDFLTLDPRIASTLYAVDRFESRAQLMQWLEAEKTVVLDRYVSSNMLHQGSKIHHDEAGLTEFLTWLDQLEHTLFAMPRPDLIMYLAVPLTVRKNLMQQDNMRAGLDVVEQDTAHQEAAEACAKKLLSALNSWVSIDCTEGGKLRSREDIHAMVYNVMQVGLKV